MNLLQPPPGLAPIASVPYGTLSSGFVGASVRGRRGIWYAFSRNDRGPTYMFPVLENGQVSRCDGTVFDPEAEMPVYNPAALGITTLQWTEDAMS